ncbi:MAG: carbohydrate kinase [Hyphomicrobiaceae bacterium]|nr:carbohydrate kinase [Hyphomicrobiaceae bacterium]
MKQFDVIGFGAAHWDRLHTTLEPACLGSSNPATTTSRPGGVARNVIAGLARMGLDVGLVSIIGRDAVGDELVDKLCAGRIDCAGLVRCDLPTACYTAVHNVDGELIIGTADMAIYDALTVEDLRPLAAARAAALWWFADTNLSATALQFLATCSDRPPLAVDAVSVVKARRLLPIIDQIDLLFCNLDEARVLAGFVDGKLADVAGALLGKGVGAVVVSNGAEGIAFGEEGMVLNSPALRGAVVDVTGAGDALMAGVLFALVGDATLEAATSYGLAAAAIAVETRGADTAMSRGDLVARLGGNATV